MPKQNERPTRMLFNFIRSSDNGNFSLRIRDLGGNATRDLFLQGTAEDLKLLQTVLFSQVANVGIGADGRWVELS